MKAYICRDWGNADTLEFGELPSPQLSKGQVRLAVKAVGMNFADTLMIEGKYQVRPDRPFVPGSEVSGEVIEVGEGVEDFSVGDRVMGLGLGALAEEAVLPATNLFPIADSMSWEQAAGFPVAYGTSHVALTRRANLQKGEKLLVLGASGGVGLTAVEIGKKMGAEVIACASTDEKLAVTKEHGADHLINYSKGDLKDQVKALGGADVVYDAVGGEAFDAALRCVNWEGRIIVVGFASGTIPQIPANRLLLKSVSVTGIFWGAYREHNPVVISDSQKELMQWFVDGALNPHISKVVPFAQAPDAFKALTGRTATGKVIVSLT